MYIQNDTLFLADVIEKFRNMCLEIYKLDPAHFLTALGLSWQASFHIRYLKANNKYMKNYDGKNNHHISSIVT